MIDNETKWDKLLNIKTSGRDDSRSDTYRYPYEPTPYSVLERLAASGYIGKSNTLVDYGCGKGRVGFFMSYQTKCNSIGVDFDSRMIEKALENKSKGQAAGRTSYELAKAEEYEIPVEADRFYFFNPFSIQLLRKVVGRIIDSYYELERKMFLFFYYPSDEYISYLMTVDELEFIDEIDCRDMFEGNNKRETIMIFSVN